MISPQVSASITCSYVHRGLSLIHIYIEKEVCLFVRGEERLNAELKYGHYDNYFDNEEEWLDYEL